LWFAPPHHHVAVGVGLDVGEVRVAVGTALHAHRTGDRRRTPGHLTHHFAIGEQHRFGAHHHPTAGHVDVDDEALGATTATHTTTLSERDHLDRFHLTDTGTLGVDDLADVQRNAPRQESRATRATVVVLGRGDETDVLAVGLAGRAQSQSFGVRAHVGLVHLPHREHGAGQLPLIQHVHHVTLVLGGVVTARQSMYTVSFDHPGVVSGGHGVETEDDGPLVETIELQVTVALDARIRCDAQRVIVHVGLDHVAMELVREVEDQMIDADLLSHAASVVDVADTATAGVAFATPQTHGDTHHVVPLLHQQCGGDRRIDPAGHGDEHLHAPQATAESPRL